MAGGWFCAVEGGEGSGKSGIARFLAEQLETRGLAVVGTREPGGTPAGERLRAMLLSGADDTWDAASELLLMTAARVEHARRVILPALASGAIVVSDRFVGSTLAYQGAGRGLSDTFIRDLHAGAVGDVWPDLTLILDLDPEIGVRRSRARLIASGADEGRFETLDMAFHRRVRAAFLDQARRDPDRHVVVDARGTPDEVQGRVATILDGWVRARGTPGGTIAG